MGQTSLVGITKGMGPVTLALALLKITRKISTIQLLILSKRFLTYQINDIVPKFKKKKLLLDFQKNYTVELVKT